jgi:hypothetical protein
MATTIANSIRTGTPWPLQMFFGLSRASIKERNFYFSAALVRSPYVSGRAPPVKPLRALTAFAIRPQPKPVDRGGDRASAGLLLIAHDAVQ